MKRNPAPRSLDLVSLRLLLAAVEERNLARVASRENIAISAVSRRISNLEQRFGVLLLNRHNRGVEPTPAALMVIARIRSVFDLLDQIIFDLGEVREGSRGMVRIQAHATAAAGTLSDLLAAFLAGHPNIDASLEESTSLQILEAVRHGSCDLGLVSGTVDAGGLELIPWASDELVAVFPAGHPLTEEHTVAFTAMLEHPFIAMQRESALVALYRGNARALGRVLIERAHVTSFDIAAKLVANGLGVAILPARPAKAASKIHDIVLRPLSEPWAHRSLALCVTDLERSSAATRDLVAFLRKVPA